MYQIYMYYISLLLLVTFCHAGDQSVPNAKPDLSTNVYESMALATHSNLRKDTTSFSEGQSDSVSNALLDDHLLDDDVYLDTEFNPRELILAGNTAGKNSFRYMAAITEHSSFHHHEYFMCGATLVAKNAVLTLASCIDDLDKKDIRVVIKGKSKYLNFQKRHKVRKIAVHPDLDVALLFFRNPSEIEPAQMETRLVNSGKGKIIGWGNTVQDPYAAGCDYDSIMCEDRLQEASIKIAPPSKCDISDPKNSWFFCGGQGGKHGDSCAGDEGGPFILNGKLYGIIYESECRRRGFRLYLRVAKYYSWIIEQINLFNSEVEYELFGNGFCRTNIEGMEHGLFRKVCNPNKGSGCPHQTCEEKCNTNEACLFYEYWTGKNKKKGTCELHYLGIEMVEEEDGVGCYKKKQPGLLCNYKPLGIGYCKTSENQTPSFETVCSRSKSLCSLVECQETCQERADCFGVEFWNNKGKHTGTCKLILEAVTKGNGNPSSICYTKSEGC